MQNRSSDSVTDTFLKEVTKIGLIGSGVATILYPFDILQQYCQTSGKSQPTVPAAKFRAHFRLGLMLSLGRTFANGFSASVKQSTTKNGILAQRGRVEDVLEKKQDIPREEQESTGGVQSTLNKNILISGVIGLTDTTLTQYFKNMRTWHIHRLCTSGLFVVPKPTRAREYFAAFKVGYNVRLAANTTTVSGFLMTPYIESRLNGLFPKNAYFDFNNLLAIGVSGGTAGLISNIFSTLYANQTIRVSHDQTYQTPSVVTVGRELIKERGVKVLFRGAPAVMLNTTIAFKAVTKMEQYAEQAVPKIAEFSASIRHRLFKPASPSGQQNENSFSQTDSWASCFSP